MLVLLELPGRKNAWLSITSTHWHLLRENRGIQKLVETSVWLSLLCLLMAQQGHPWLLVPGVLDPRPPPLVPDFPASFARTTKKIPVGNRLPMGTSPLMSSNLVTMLKG